jgi:hypothetical protein
MGNESNAVPLSGPEAGAGSQPSLNVAPPPARWRRTPSVLNLKQQREISRTLQICAAARKPEYASVLAANKVPAEFVTALEHDATTARQKAEAALRSTTAKEGSTAEASEAKDKLVASLRCLQSAARSEHMLTDPEKVKNYLVGQDIAGSRVALESAAETIVNLANAERPGSVNTEFLQRVQDERAAYVAAHGTQQADKGSAKQERVQRDQMLASIVARRKKIQYTADTAWPPGQSGSAKARVEFQLPAKRPFSY